VRAELEISTVVNSVVVIVSSTPPLYGDAAMIEQAFSNIIGNAVKYSSRSSNPVVRIEGHIAGKNIIYSVSDNGIGIDKKYHSRIFELFQRLDNAKDYDGTGVGLAIVKRIVERHEGQIWFESEPGQGTTFFLRFKNETPP
jgi:signal transduction histidine kinase